MILLLCIKDGVKYLEDRVCENVYILNVKLTSRLNIAERGFACSKLMAILPTGSAYHKIQTNKNCQNLDTISAEVDVNTISYSAFAECENLKEVDFHPIMSFRTVVLPRKIWNWATVSINLEFITSITVSCSKPSNLVGLFDKFHFRAIKGASGLYSQELHTSADSLYIPPDCFQTHHA